MKMTIGRTWKAKMTPNGPPFVSEGPEEEFAADLGVFEHGVNAGADGLKDFSEIGAQHQDGEQKLQAQAPGQDSQADGVTVARQQRRLHRG